MNRLLTGMTGAVLVWPLFTSCDIAAQPVSSPAYPARPVRIIVPQAAGGALDIMGRVVGQKLTDSLGQQFVVDNRPGANGIIGLEAAAKSKADGYTLVMGAPSALTVNPYAYKNIPYETLRDFAPITQISTITYVLVVNPTLPVRSVKELIALAKSRPGELNYSSAGVGNLNHLSAELFSARTGIKMQHIPNKGDAPAIADLMGGEVALLFTTLPSVISQINAGKLRALAVCGNDRSTILTDVPTLKQAGVSGVDITGWAGILAPAGTPADIVGKLQLEIAKAVNLPDVREVLARQGALPIGSTSEQFSAFIRSEAAKWGKVIKDAGISLSQ